MYKITNVLSEINHVRILDSFFDGKQIDEIHVMESEYLYYGNKQMKTSIDHINNKHQYKGKVEWNGYENGVWIFDNKELVIFQDYGDYEYNPPKDFIEINKKLVYVNDYSRSVGFYNGYVCLLLSKGPILNIVLLEKMDPIPFNDINYKKPYNLKFLIEKPVDANNIFSKQVFLYIEFRNVIEKHIPLKVTYGNLVQPSKINLIVHCNENDKKFEKESQQDYKDRLLEESKYITGNYLLRKGFSYITREEDFNYFQKNDIKIYEDGLTFFSLDEGMENCIWHQKDVEDLLK